MQNHSKKITWPFSRWPIRLFFVLFSICLFGNVVREQFAGGLWVETEFDLERHPLQITFFDGSSIVYSYDQGLLKAVSRINSHGELLYRHTYDEYDEEERLLRETHLSSVEYGYDSMGRPAYRKDAYLSEDYVFDCEGNLSQRGGKCYSYDGKAQLVAEEPEGFVAEYDDRFNCIKLNDQWVTSKSQVHAADTFDGFGRRLTHGNTCFLYVGNEEIASCENGKLKELRILGGFRRAVGIEIDSVVYVPIHDIQGTIRYLVDWKTGVVKERNDCDAFGRGVNPKIPYAYLGKRYDADTGLFYFGKRFYDPFATRWTSPDPLGPMQCDNLYQYVFNNPFRYIDPYGESVWGFLGGLGEIVLGGTLCITGGVLEVASLGTYTIGFGFQEAAGMALITDGLGRSIYHSQNVAWKKNAPQDNPKLEYKKPKPNLSGKEGAKDVPSWAKGKRPYKHESGKEFAKRLLDEKYGSGNYDIGVNSPFNKIKKWGDRAWE